MRHHVLGLHDTPPMRSAGVRLLVRRLKRMRHHVIGHHDTPRCDQRVFGFLCGGSSECVTTSLVSMTPPRCDENR